MNINTDNKSQNLNQFIAAGTSGPSQPTTNPEELLAKIKSAQLKMGWISMN